MSTIKHGKDTNRRCLHTEKVKKSSQIDGFELSFSGTCLWKFPTNTISNSLETYYELYVCQYWNKIFIPFPSLLPSDWRLYRRAHRVDTNKKHIEMLPEESYSNSYECQCLLCDTSDLTCSMGPKLYPRLVTLFYSFKNYALSGL